ncbi:hypothetical protein [Streptomyces xanthophaeus]
MTAGQPDFTADAMTAIPHPSGEGLYIPNMDIADEWDRADPIAHTEMVLEAIDKTENTFARAVRLLKHWNCTHSKPLCSWNIKALALESITTPMPLIDALQAFFAHAAREFKSGQTQDPSGVAGPIPLNLPISEARKRLDTARDYIDLAIQHEAEGRPVSAQHALSRVKPGATSKHRYSTDGALCLWYPYDPEECRWTSPKGLLHQLEIVWTHLFLEHYWRLTDGENGGEWLVEDAPHGLPGNSGWGPASSSRPRRRRAAGRGPRRPP